MTDFSKLTKGEARRKQMKFYLSSVSHIALHAASKRLQLSMSAIVDEMIQQEFPPEPPAPKRDTPRNRRRVAEAFQID